LVESHPTCYDEKWAHMAMNPPFHADHVGSLRRPQPLIEAHSSSLQGKLNPQALKELEDKAIDDAIAMQERVGLQAITDGEIRRNNWRDRFFERVDGFSREKIASSFVLLIIAASNTRACQSRWWSASCSGAKASRRTISTT
jgi:hypothetical protein